MFNANLLLTLHIQLLIKEMEKTYWAPHQDSILRYLRQERKIQRWTQIARTLADQFKIKGRNGKNCRERYQEKFDASDEKVQWIFQQEKILFKLHNQLGNKWAVISRHLPGRSDNQIKNHFYSKLRKGVRKLNKFGEENFGKSHKEIKFNVLFKIIQANEDSFKLTQLCERELSKFCYDLKNSLIKFSYDQNQQHDYETQNLDIEQLYEDINSFGKNYKRKPKKFRRHSGSDQKLLQGLTVSRKIVSQNGIQNEEEMENDSQNSEEHSFEYFYSKQQKQTQNKFLNFHDQTNQFKSTVEKQKRQRKVSAQTQGIQEVLAGSGILQEEHFLPMLELTKKRTSNFDLLSLEGDKQNQFFDQSANQDYYLQMRELATIKRWSHADDIFFQ